MGSGFAVELDDVTVARARRGDLAALEALFRAFERPVYNLGRRLLGDGHDAEDMLQETFVEVVRSVKSFRGDAPLGAWVRKVAASKALMRLRRDRARPGEEALDDFVEGGEDGGHPPAGLAAVPERLDLEKALAELPDTARMVVWLHDVEGYTHEEIAAMAGRTASFSKSQLARAHVRLRERLAPGGESKPCTQS